MEGTTIPRGLSSARLFEDFKDQTSELKPTSERASFGRRTSFCAPILPEKGKKKTSTILYKKNRVKDGQKLDF